MSKATIRTAEPGGTSPQGVADTGIIRIKTSDGHTIGLRSLGVLEEMRLLKVLGEYNTSYYSFCSQVARVCEIDNSPVPTPNNEREIEIVAQRIGRAGIAALMEAIVTTAEVADDKEKEQVKK